MSTLIWFVVLLVGIVAVRMWWQSAKQKADVRAAGGAPQQVRAASRPAAPVVAPSGRFELWGQTGAYGVDVVGESFYADHLRRLVAGQQSPYFVPAMLVRQPANPHDANAVAVVAGGAQVGHLSRQDAAAYAPVLDALAARGVAGTVDALISWWDDDEDISPGVRLDLAAPGSLVPLNAPPAQPYAILPPGRAINVARLEAGALAPMMASVGISAGACPLYGVLTPVESPGGKMAVAVSVDGVRVGTMTPASSAHVIPQVTHIGVGGLVPVAHLDAAVLPGQESLKVCAERASDLPVEWFQAPAPRAG